jgi:hypothetical protein
MTAVRRVACLMVIASAGGAHGASFDYRFDVGVEKVLGDLPAYLPTQPRPWKPADALLHARVDLGALLADRVFVGPFLDGGVALSCRVDFCLFYRVGGGALVHLGPLTSVHPWLGAYGGYHLLSMKLVQYGQDDYPTAGGGFGQLRLGIDFPLRNGSVVAPVLGAELGTFRFKGMQSQGAISLGIAFRP